MEKNIDAPSSSARGVVRVSVPVSAFSNLGKMQEVTKSILGRLGCGACHSGWDLRFTQIAQFVVDENLKVHAGGVIIEG